MTELLEHEVKAELGEPSWWSLRWVQEVDSTNRELMRTAELPEGTVLVAEHQSAGRGRLDRSWASSRGKSILCSLLVRPQNLEHSPLLTIVLANAIVTTGRALGVPLLLKWPNDVGVVGPEGFQKIAGVLAEAKAGTVVLGFGCNVLPDESRPASASSLSAHCTLLPSRSVILAGVLNNFLVSYRSLQAEGPEKLLVEFEERCDTLSRQVRIEQAQGHWQGIARSIDSDGRLIVERNGENIVVSSGDVVHLRTVDEEQ